MAIRRTLELSQEERTELKEVRDHSGKAYLRERAAALLKISGGMSPHAVARSGLLKPRAPDTVYEWLNRYEQEGISSLKVREGRGRKPAFSPSATRR